MKAETTHFEICLNSEITPNRPRRRETLEEAKAKYERQIREAEAPPKINRERLRRAHAVICLNLVSEDGETLDTIESHRL